MKAALRAALALGMMASMPAMATEAPQQAPTKAGPSRIAERNALRRAFDLSGGATWRGSRYPKNSGWTDARYRRAALKKRNQARNRRACK